MSDPKQPDLAPFRNKTLAGALALFGGTLGAHRMYLGGRFWWVYPLLAMPALGLALQSDDWIRNPGFLFAVVVAVVTLLEAILICLTPDAKWDASHNPGHERQSSSGWAAVIVVIIALMLGAIALMSVLAIALEGYFEARRAAR